MRLMDVHLRKISNKKVCLILLKLMKMLDLYKDSKLLLKLIGFSSLNNLFFNFGSIIKTDDEIS